MVRNAMRRFKIQARRPRRWVAALGPARAGVRRRAGGFTLVELMIVAAVVAILAVIALPIYKNQIRESRRPEAKTALLDLASREERYFTLNNAYTANVTLLGYTLNALGSVSLGANATPDYYLQAPVVVAAVQGANGAWSLPTYTLTATAVNDQAKDVCGNYLLDNFGNQTTSLSPAGVTCW